MIGRLKGTVAFSGKVEAGFPQEDATNKKLIKRSA